MEIRAKVTAVCQLESGSTSKGEWKRATVIVEYMDGDYPHKVALINTKKADAFAKIPVGSTGTFNINLNSREYQGKFYTTIDCWSWRLDGNTQNTSPAPQTQASPQSGGSNDLPY